MVFFSLFSFCRRRCCLFAEFEQCVRCACMCASFDTAYRISHFTAFLICGLHATTCVPYNWEEFIQWAWKHAVNIRRAHVLPGLNSKWSNSFWIMQSTDVRIFYWSQSPIMLHCLLSQIATQLYEKSTLILSHALKRCDALFELCCDALYFFGCLISSANVLNELKNSGTHTQISDTCHFLTLKIWNREIM